MTILLNSCYGVFTVPKEVMDIWKQKDNDCAYLHADVEDDLNEIRTNKDLIEFMRTEEGQIWNKTNQMPTELVEVEFPDEATDWDVFTIDGFETLIYVLDGKLHFVNGLV